MSLTKTQMLQVMDTVFSECHKLREAGQAEYAHEDVNAFRNFESCSTFLDVERKKVLMIYLFKHFDGIASYIRGHQSQREDVRGRINDAIVYLCLLRGMLEDDAANNIKIPYPQQTLQGAGIGRLGRG